MNIKSFASICAVLPLFALGCSTKTDDCNKVITVYNAHVEAQNKIDLDKPGGTDAMAVETDKYDTDLAAVPVKDEGVKAKTAAMIDANTKWATEYKSMLATLKHIEDIKVPSGADEASMKKFNADLDGAKAKMDASKATLDTLKTTKKKASDDFDSYCGVTTAAAPSASK